MSYDENVFMCAHITYLHKEQTEIIQVKHSGLQPLLPSKEVTHILQNT